MKKTSFILGLSLSAILAIAGCANNTTNDQAIIDKLSSQLDRVTNAVSAVSVANIDEIAREDLGGLQFTSQSTLSNAHQPASAIAKNIENNRFQILKKAKAIKKSITGGELKLGNENARAISELTTSMQKYATELTRTKSDYRNTVRSMSKLDDVGTQFNAKLTRLSCCLESRECYMNNILNSLNNVESIINSLENNSNENSTTNKNENIEQNTNKATTNDWGNKTPEDYENQSPNQSNNSTNFNLPNINFPQNYNPNQFNFTPNCPDGNCYNYNNCPDGNCYYYNNCPDGNCYNFPSTCENGACYNNVAGMNAYGYNRGMFNPSRNTDTYGPGITNIDTYRYTGNGAGYGFGTNGQGMRHFNGSNGINNIMPSDNLEHRNEDLLQEEQIQNNSVKTTITEEKNEIAEATKENASNAKEQELETASDDEKKIVTSSQQSKSKTLKPQPKKAETLEIETESKIKTVSAPKIDNDKQISKDEQILENTQKTNGEDKVKGHTSVTQADINKDIKELLK